jgi:hypothetical protein
MSKLQDLRRRSQSEAIMTKQDKFDQLLLELNAKPLNGTCEFILTNGTPPEWDVVIQEGGAKFFYSDGSDDIDGPKLIQLRSGGSYTFRSGHSNLCVKQVFLGITVRVPGEEDQTLTYATEIAPEGQCWIRQGVELGKKAAISEQDIARTGRTRLLQIKAAS